MQHLSSLPFSGAYYLAAAFKQTASVDHVTYIFCIGLIGVYDFGSMCPYTMIDNAVIIFTVIFTILSFAQSLIVKILYMVLTSCVSVEISISPHYLLFAILPLSTEFLHGQKLCIMYIYLYLMVASITYLAIMTLTMSKLLHSEFRSVNNMYIVGIMCFLGFGFSLPISVSMSTSRVLGLILGLNITVLYLGGFKVAIIMWVYGVRRFSTDINFWLGFKPTKFWTTFWVVLPIVLFLFVINHCYLLAYMDDMEQMITAVVWVTFTFVVVAIFQIRTVARYVLSNNLAAILKSSRKYGPAELGDRKLRRSYNESLRHRQCRHNCHILDERIDCNHLPLMFMESKENVSLSYSESPSLTHIYQAGPSKKHPESSHLMDVNID